MVCVIPCCIQATGIEVGLLSYMVCDTRPSWTMIMRSHSGRVSVSGPLLHLCRLQCLPLISSCEGLLILAGRAWLSGAPWLEGCHAQWLGNLLSQLAPVLWTASSWRHWAPSCVSGGVPSAVSRSTAGGAQGARPDQAMMASSVLLFRSPCCKIRREATLCPSPAAEHLFTRVSGR